MMCGTSFPRSGSGTVDFAPGAGVAILTADTAFGKGAYFLAKYDAQGGLVHVRQLAHDVNAVTTDPSGNVYITGSFGGTVDFDPGAGTASLVSNGSTDIFLAKYSPAGALLHAFRLNGTTTGTEEGVSLAADAGGVFLGGRFNGTLDLDPGAGAVSLSSNGVDGFIAGYDHSGAFIFGNNYDGNLYALALDAGSNIWVTGSIADSMDADLGPGRAMLYSANNFDVYLVKYSSAGAFLQGRAFQSDSNYNPEEGIAVNHEGSAYIYGRYRGTVDFNPGGSGGSFTTSGSFDSYAMKYNAGASFVTGFSIGNSNNNERVTGMAIDNVGRIWISGNFTGTLDLDPDAGTAAITSTPHAGGYIARYNDGETKIASGIGGSGIADPAINVYGGDNKVFVDFTALDKVNARVKVLNTLGQTIAEASHSMNDMLRLELPDAAPQVYVVIVSHGITVHAKKVWVD